MAAPRQSLCTRGPNPTSGQRYACQFVLRGNPTFIVEVGRPVNGLCAAAQRDKWYVGGGTAKQKTLFNEWYCDWQQTEVWNVMRVYP